MRAIGIGSSLALFVGIDHTGRLFNWEWIPRFNLIASITVFRVNIGFEYAWKRKNHG